MKRRINKQIDKYLNQFIIDCIFVCLINYQLIEVFVYLSVCLSFFSFICFPFLNCDFSECFCVLNEVFSKCKKIELL